MRPDSMSAAGAVAPIPRSLWVRLAVAYMLLGLAAAWYAPRAAFDAWWVHGLWCGVGLACALPVLLRAFRQSFAVMLTDHRIVFLGAFSLYFLFGAALLGVGPEQTVYLAMALYPIEPSGALRVDAINGLGFGIALLTSTLARGRWLSKQATDVAKQAGRISPSVVVILYFVTGILSTAYVVPFDYGFRDGTVSGSVRMLTRFSLLAVFVAAASRGPHERLLRSVAVGSAVLLALYGTVSLLKQEALLPLMALIAGLALRFGTRRVLPLGLTLVAVVFMLLGSVVNYARVENRASGRLLTVSERWSVIKDSWTTVASLDELGGYNFWGRLCYVPTQKAALDFQDQGFGRGLGLMLWVPVPRVVAPNKPEMTEMFTELHVFITGSPGSATFPGVFISGYYHAGWWGVLVASIACGWVIAQTSAIARVFHAHHAIALLPLSMLGLYIAFRIDGDFIPDYLGNFTFIVYPLLAAAFVLSLIGHRSARARQVGPSV